MDSDKIPTSFLPGEPLPVIVAYEDIPVLPTPIGLRQSLDDPHLHITMLKRLKTGRSCDLAGLIAKQELVHCEILLPIITNPPHHHT